MKVIFLSAGKGSRMMPLTKNTPKPLLNLGNGLTIIESQLNSIAECGGIDEVIFIIGYRAEQIEAKLKGHSKVSVRFIYNPFYDVSNNLISLWLACGEMDKDLIVINGDDIFKANVLRGLLKQPSGRNIVMVIDRKKSYETEDMKVVIKKDRVVRVNKEISVAEANGESIGMFRFTGPGKKYLKDTLNAMVREERAKNIFYLAAIQKMIDEGRGVHYMECKADDWAEVDFHPDLNLIRDNMFRGPF